MTPSELNCSHAMDTPKPPQKPNHLLDDLESIREFLSNNEPSHTGIPDDLLDLPLLTDSVEMGQIPLLSDIVVPGHSTPVSAPTAPLTPPPSATRPLPAAPSIPAAPAHTPPPAVVSPDPSPAAAVAPAAHAPTAGTASAAIAQTHAPQPATPVQPSITQAVQRSVESSNTTSDLLRLDAELRAAAQLILQDVIDDFVPQIEAELKRRLEARLTRLLPQRKS
ncbi:hypothetical protein ACVW0Y_003310 [Pseudomonas sp. TE3786]